MCIRRLFSEPGCGNTFLRDVMYQLLTPYHQKSYQLECPQVGDRLRWSIIKDVDVICRFKK